MRTAASPRAPRIDSVKALLSRRLPTLKPVTDSSARQNSWEKWLSERLSPQLYSHVSTISERDGRLIIFATSAAWCARLRYAVLELEGGMREAQPALSAIEVRVLPRG
jgi:hypothetical protein